MALPTDHARKHRLDSTDDHLSQIPPGRILVSDARGLPSDRGLLADRMAELQPDATAGNLGVFDGDGQVIDGGVAQADVVAMLPTTDQKAALAGTSGSPSDTNRYVTDQDARLVAGSGSVWSFGERYVPAAVGFDLVMGERYI